MLTEQPKQTELALDKNALPSHVAIIMDGNRRWAKERALPIQAGHWKGVQQISSVVRCAKKIGIKKVTLFALSTENWQRSKEELSWLMHLFRNYLRQRSWLLEEGVRLQTIGQIEALPYPIYSELCKTIEETKECKKVDLVLAINYGGRDELRRAAIALAKDAVAGKVDLEAVTEQVFEKYLDTATWKSPDLLIRTSGEQRISNFLLWQTAYSEMMTLDVKWPSFSEEHFLKALLAFQQRKRRFGG